MNGQVRDKTTREAAQSPPGLPERRHCPLSPGKVQYDVSDSKASRLWSTRGQWASKAEFLLACIGWSVGIGNVWRFPYLAYSNGGGAFLIPYLIMLILVGNPMYFMELLLGQFGGVGSLTIWHCAPITKGVGYAIVILSLIVAIYYNVVLSYTLYYMFASMQDTLPWTLCGQEWNTGNCVVRRVPLVPCYGNWTGYQPDACLCPTNTSLPLLRDSNCTCTGNTTVDAYYLKCFMEPTTDKPVSSSEEYWLHHVLDISNGIEEVGFVRWELCLCLLSSWLIVFFCLIKGVTSAGKVVYFTATFPYIILIILLARGVTLDGAAEGILYFITPTWEKLLDVKVWKDAACQMFFSLGVAWGGLITLGSYNKFNNNVYNDALLVSILDTLTSLLSGFVIFSVLGAMSKELNIPIDEVATGGQGLAFIAYPEALARLPIPQLWSTLFFSMLFILGLDSEFALLENVLTAISDEYPHYFRAHKSKCTAIACLLCLFLGLPCITRGGQYVLNLMETYAGGFAVLFLGISECCAISWVYGVRRFSNDANLMLGFRPGIYWMVAWAVLSPFTLAVTMMRIPPFGILVGRANLSTLVSDWMVITSFLIFVFSLAVFTPLTYGSYDYPNWADGIGWAMALLVMVQVPLWAAISLVQQRGSFLQRLNAARLPTVEWGPSDPIARRKYLDEGADRVTLGSVNVGVTMFAEEWM